MAPRKRHRGAVAHAASAPAQPAPRQGPGEGNRTLLERQSQILDLIARGAALPEVVSAVVRSVERHAPLARCAVALFDRDSRRPSHAHGPRLPIRLVQALGALGPRFPAAFAAKAPRKAMMIADLAAGPMDPEFRDQACAAGFSACLIHPIPAEGDLILGAVLLFYPAANTAQKDDEVLLELMTPVVRIAAELDQRLQALLSADERFTSLAASVPGVVYQRLVTPQGDIRYTYISEGVRDLFGVAPEEVLADPRALFNRHDPSYAATFRERLLSASRSLEMWDVEATIISRDGKQKHTHAIARPHLQRDGSVLWNGLILDQTRIKKAEMATAAAEARTRQAIIESLPQGLALFDANDKLIVCNSAFLKLYPGLEGIAVAGASYDSVISAEFGHDISTTLVSVEDWLRSRREQHNGRQQGTERQLSDGRWILVTERRTADGGTVVLHTDVTALKRREEERSKLQDQLYRAQKMEAMGRLAGGIAHDFNNLLASILGNATFLVEDLPPHSETRDFAEQIRTAGERAKDLVQQILAFSRHQESEQRNIDPQSIIDETVQLLRAALPKSINLDVRPDAGRVTIRGNATQLVQVLVNLCVNARDAIGDRHGRISLETDLVPAEGTNRGPKGPRADILSGGLGVAGRRIATGPLDGGTPYLRVKVRDTGCGMDAATMDRMFEPFFTTKEVGKGTGLGLAAVHGIVSAHHGVVAATSKLGHGTTFEVFIPTVAAEPAAETHSAADKPSGSEALLVVDDEPQVSAMLAKMLARLGYKVDCFNTAPEALAAFTRAPAAWAVVIVDHTMPQMTGLELAKRILAQSPRQPIVLCSGYTDTVSNDAAAAAGIKAFLTKPVDHAVLARTIRDLLDAGSPAEMRRARAFLATGGGGP